MIPLGKINTLYNTDSDSKQKSVRQTHKQLYYKGIKTLKCNINVKPLNN